MDITVRQSGPNRWDGLLVAGDMSFRCALGLSGILVEKREGDGGTPAGIYPLRRVLYRPDRISATPRTGLPLSALTTADGWCDDPQNNAYNRAVILPFSGSAEHLWREDAVYDVIVIIGHNDAPAIRGRGSAIFMHLASDDYSATEGCIALSLNDLLAVLEKCTPQSRLLISADQ